jgi:nucleoside-triphosphatase THEP1
MVNRCSQKVGTWGVDVLGGERRVLARTDQDLGGPTVGPYSFDAVALDWAVDVVERAAGRCDLLVVDEIGKLELWQGVGLVAILPQLVSGKIERSLVLVRDFLLPELQSRLEPVEPTVFRVNEESRGELPPRVLGEFFP